MSNRRKASDPAAFLARRDWSVVHQAGEVHVSIAAGDELATAYYLRTLSEVIRNGHFKSDPITGIVVTLDHKRNDAD